MKHKHEFKKISNNPGQHACESISYCMHYLTKCACGKQRVAGHADPEVR